jgi:hypothetical protein
MAMRIATLFSRDLQGTLTAMITVSRFNNDRRFVEQAFVAMRTAKSAIAVDAKARQRYQEEIRQYRNPIRQKSEQAQCRKSILASDSPTPLTDDFSVLRVPGSEQQPHNQDSERENQRANVATFVPFDVRRPVNHLRQVVRCAAPCSSFHFLQDDDIAVGTIARRDYLVGSEKKGLCDNEGISVKYGSSEWRETVAPE